MLRRNGFLQGHDLVLLHKSHVVPEEQGAFFLDLLFPQSVEGPVLLLEPGAQAGVTETYVSQRGLKARHLGRSALQSPMQRSTQALQLLAFLQGLQPKAGLTSARFHCVDLMASLASIQSRRGDEERAGALVCRRRYEGARSPTCWVCVQRCLLFWRYLPSTNDVIGLGALYPICCLTSLQQQVRARQTPCGARILHRPLGEPVHFPAAKADLPRRAARQSPLARCFNTILVLRIAPKGTVKAATPITHAPAQGFRIGPRVQKFWLFALPLLWLVYVSPPPPCATPQHSEEHSVVAGVDRPRSHRAAV